MPLALTAAGDLCGQGGGCHLTSTQTAISIVGICGQRKCQEPGLPRTELVGGHLPAVWREGGGLSVRRRRMIRPATAYSAGPAPSPLNTTAKGRREGMLRLPP
jgi:hypothetical protein